MSRMLCAISLLCVFAQSGCGTHRGESAALASQSLQPPGESPQMVYRDVAGAPLGEPLAVSVDFSGNVYAADGAPARLICWLAEGKGSVEFQKPSQQPGFYPSDIAVSGFFVYALDPVERSLLRFDNRGAYRDVLIQFDEISSGRRIVPVGLDVDSYGRIAVSDVGNQQVIVFDSNLAVELVFGSYGSHEGQFDGPEGVAFTQDGGFVVTDTGNRRIQVFDSGGKFSKTLPAIQPSPLIKPRRAAIDKDGNVYVSDPEAGRVFVFGKDGALSRSIVLGGARGFRPTDIEVDPSGSIYVTDAANASVFVFR